MFKRLFSRGVLPVALAMTVVALAPSCSSDDELAGSVEFVDCGSDAAISTSMEGGVFTLPVKATGKWSATVVMGSEEDKWLSLLNGSGEGDGTVELLMEPNCTDAVRTCTVVITCGDSRITCSVRQGNEVALEYTEDNGEVDYSVFEGTAPVGFGMQITNLNGKTKFYAGQIFMANKYGADKFKAKDYTDNYISPADYIHTSDVPRNKIKLSTARDFQNHEDSIGAYLSVSVGYGMFKMGLEGSFQMQGNSSDTIVRYTAISEQPVATVGISYADLLSLYDELAEANAVERKLVITPSFADLRTKIEESVANGADADDPELGKLLAKLDKNYGPVFCTDATLGGSCNLAVELSKGYSETAMNITGQLTASFSSLFSLDASASANYFNSSKSFLESSTITIDVTGGTKAARSALVTSLGQLNILSDPSIGTPVPYGDLTTNINKWADSIDPAAGGTFTCTGYSMEGIWKLFGDEAQEVIKSYLLSKYKNGSDGKCPYLVNIKQMIDED